MSFQNCIYDILITSTQFFNVKVLVQKFLNVLNPQHKDVEITMEKATSTLISLDVKMNDTEYDSCM